MSDIPNIRKLRENPETARAGFPWSADETRNLCEKLTTATNPPSREWYEEIARECRRTPSAIHAQIIHLAVRMLMTDAGSADEIAARMKISREELQREHEKKLAPRKAQKALRNKLLIHCDHLEKDLEFAKKEIANLRATIEKLKC